jgi:hypothetical protein
MVKIALLKNGEQQAEAIVEVITIIQGGKLMMLLGVR